MLGPDETAPTPVLDKHGDSPIDLYLRRQADLRVVERFARADVADRIGRWSGLIPISEPEDGRQYRFEVDLDACTGCKACVTACHNLNGLDDGESFRSTGLLLRSPTEPQPPTPVQQTVTTACHHCVDPGCLTGCPAEAYEKDPVTGIVKHLDDACIGCRYCTLTCPYEVPLFNDRLGIVRKCDLCADRLADGEAPACVQGCPTEAISVSTVDPAELAPEPADRLVPGAAVSELTRPTTNYRGRFLDTAASDRPPATTAIGDGLDPQPAHAHLPLVGLLVLSQWSVGLVLASLVLASAEASFQAAAVRWLLIGAVVSATGSVASSVAHLGQPLKGWRAVLGWRHSWLSREVLALTGYLMLLLAALWASWATTTAADGVVDPTAVGGPGGLLGGAPGDLAAASSAAVVGLATVGCSAMIYIVTGRRWWRPVPTGVRFVGTTALAACAAVSMATGWSTPLAALAAVVVLLARLSAERPGTAAGTGDTGPGLDPDDLRTELVLAGPLAGAVRARIVAGVTGMTLIVVATALTNAVSVPVGLLGTACVFGSDLIERRLFFQACVPLTMPGAHR
jgi:Fe-S-cluster-containing dehydrogenase component/DMSO reductase anchor subunit